MHQKEGLRGIRRAFALDRMEPVCATRSCVVVYLTELSCNSSVNQDSRAPTSLFRLTEPGG